MSELRVDNIVSQDGTAAPIYTKGLNIGAGQTLTNAGDYTVSGQSLLYLGTLLFQGGAVSHGGGVTVTATGCCKRMVETSTLTLVFLLVEH